MKDIDRSMTLDYPKTQWRCLQTLPSRGAWNMAVDEALLEGMGDGSVLPVLRLYAWEPPCLSLGYAQTFSDVDLAQLATRAWDLVRRPTGGKAILHTDELTYAVIAPHTEPRLAGSVLESYQRLSIALLAALRRLGLQAESNPLPHLENGNDLKGPVCFQVPSNYEITVHKKKLIGSAQARRREGILQHGSLPLYGDLRRVTQVLDFHTSNSLPDLDLRSAAAERLSQHATTVSESLGRRVSWQDAAQAFTSAFQEVLNLELIPASLSRREQDRASQLMEVKYANDSWTRRV